MSFFDDDDQPTRTTRTPRPRRAGGRAASAGGPTDQQQLMIRRAIAIGVLVILLIVIVLGFKSCRDNARKNSLRDYNREVATIVQDSDTQVSKPLFDLLTSNQNQSPVTLETQINQYRVVADQQAQRARDLDVPGQMTGRPAPPDHGARLPRRGAGGRRRPDPGRARLRPGGARTPRTRSPARCRSCWPPTSSTRSAWRR